MPGTEQDIVLTAQPGTGPQRRGTAVRSGKAIGCPIDDQLMLVIGTGGPAASELRAEFNDDSESQVSATIVSWPLATPLASDTHGFAALATVNTVRQRALTTIRFLHEAKARRYIFAPRPARLDEAVATIAELAGSHFPEAIDALADALMKGPIGRRRLSAITTLLQKGARADGRIELIGETQSGEIFLQGWERELPAGICRVFVSGETPSVAECAVALYPRQDVPRDASGFIGLLLASEALNMGSIEGLLFQRQGAWRYLPVDERRLVAGPLETPGLIRSLLLDTRGSSEALLRLRSAANRFDGSETVSSLPLPVRMGVDNAFHTEGGFLVSGWLLDPDSHVDAVKLCGQGADARIDDRWARLDRSDVTSAFADEALFAGALEHAGHAHGFVVFAEGSKDASSVPLHLELTLRDSRRAFLPLTCTQIPARKAALRQIRSIDPADWALAEIIDHQIIPLLHVSERPSPAVATVSDLGPFDDAAGPAIIIGVAENEEQDITALLALLALDSQTRQAPLALVVPAESRQRLATRLGRLAAFYNLPLRLIGAEGAADVYDLFEAGAQAVARETVVLLSASLVPREAGWYGRLLAAYDSKKESIISPTLVYEDDSVRWAGSWIGGEDSSRPLLGRYAGYPASAVTGLGVMPIAAASFECCIMPREALFLAGGFSHGYLGSQEKGLDLGLKLARSGLRSHWLPSVQMMGSDDATSADSAATAVLVEQVDRKIFDARWAPLLSGGETKSAQALA